ncbi:septum formation protein Maf [Candidatus Desantisbacteria bacterium]|nr:septum formation protein Maf [Candidatus Desantisbacteria bacterium]
MKKIILASASPRRRELMEQYGIEFEVYPASIPEHEISADTPEGEVVKIAFEKAEQIANLHPDDIVIGADTIVVYKDAILGKPENEKDAIKMLKFLSGKTHYVLTGLVIINKSGNVIISDYEKTYVSMRELSLEEIENYVAGREPMDKAGAYAIQGEARDFIIDVQGCFYNVVGLPVNKLKEMLGKLEKKVEGKM